MRWILLLLLSVLMFSCAEEQERTDQKQDSTHVALSNPNPDSIAELTPEQQTAFDAFNTIQVHGEHLYSTFSGIHHNCPSPDTSFVITRAELLIALKELFARHYTNFSLEERNKLAEEAVQAQEEYLVLQCGFLAGPSGGNEFIPQSGSWILPELLRRRDVVIEW